MALNWHHLSLPRSPSGDQCPRGWMRIVSLLPGRRSRRPLRVGIPPGGRFPGGSAHSPNVSVQQVDRGI
jgi:hypothetical protein